MTNKTEHLGVITYIYVGAYRGRAISVQSSAETVSEASSRYGEVDSRKTVSTTFKLKTLASAGVLCYNISNMALTRPCWRSIASP